MIDSLFKNYHYELIVFAYLLNTNIEMMTSCLTCKGYTKAGRRCKRAMFRVWMYIHPGGLLNGLTIPCVSMLKMSRLAFSNRSSTSAARKEQAEGEGWGNSEDMN